MGRTSHRPSSEHDHKHHRGLDKHPIGNSADAAKQWGIPSSSIGDSGRQGPTVASGDDEDRSSSGIDSDRVSERVDNIRNKHDERIRVSRGSPGQIERSFDAAAYNAVLNDPGVLPHIAPLHDSIDISSLVADPHNFLLTTEGGGLFFNWHEHGSGIYEVHNNWLPKYRGRYAFDAALSALRWMFTHTDCMSVLTKVPECNKAARWAARAVGGTEEFTRKNAWETKQGKFDISYWALRYDDWVRQTPDLMKSGKWFHKALETEFVRHGVTEPQHEDEDCHDLHVGACVEMIKGGQSEKAVILYNRWARFAGYGFMSLVARNPLVLDIGNALLQVKDDDFKVILCR